MDLTGNVWFPALMVFCAAVFGTLSLALGWELLRDWLHRLRTRRFLSAVMKEGPLHSPAAAKLLREDSSEDSYWAAFIDLLPGRETAEKLLRHSGVPISPETLMMLTLASAGGAGFGILLVTGSLFFTAIATAIGASIPYLYVARRRKKRFYEFEEQFPEAIELLTRAIRAGHPISSGMRMVAEEASPVVAEEFRQTFEEQRYGIPFEDALLSMVDRMDLVDVRIFVTAVLIQREVGGNLAEILDNLAETIRGRFYIRRQLRVYTAQGRLSGWILAALPPVVGLVVFFLQPEYILLLFENVFGLFLVFTALTLQILGVLWIRSIINIDI